MPDRPHVRPSHPSARRRRVAATAAFAMTAVLAPATAVAPAGAAPGADSSRAAAPPSGVAIAGALVSTAPDLNEFRRALEDGDLISKRLVRIMQRPVSEGDGPAYGLGSYRLASPCSNGPRWVQGHDGGSFCTLTFSVGLGNNRQLTIAITGRGYTKETVVSQGRLLQKFAYTALAATCAEDGTSRRRNGIVEWPQLVDVAAARTPAA